MGRLGFLKSILQVKLIVLHVALYVCLWSREPFSVDIFKKL